ncbi:hypothetical protein C8J57DRAFT_1486098 [Mycena rebaudengoi]|nr:hypothetical protein C8J57DRAFT_1486098 [Mycena rebaudengoi]
MTPSGIHPRISTSSSSSSSTYPSSTCAPFPPADYGGRNSACVLQNNAIYDATSGRRCTASRLRKVNDTKTKRVVVLSGGSLQAEEPKVSARRDHGHATTAWSTVRPYPLAFDYIPEHCSSFRANSIGLPTRPRQVTGGGRQ